MRVPSGDQATSSTASGRSHTTTTSPGPPTGMTFSECDPSRERVKASLRPSGDHAGCPSPCSPDVSGYGAVEPSVAASHTARR